MPDYHAQGKLKQEMILKNLVDLYNDSSLNNHHGCDQKKFNMFTMDKYPDLRTVLSDDDWYEVCGLLGQIGNVLAKVYLREIKQEDEGGIK